MQHPDFQPEGNLESIRGGMSSYYAKLRDPRWQRKRLEILSRDSFTCVACGDKDNELHVHHGYYEPGKDPWDYADHTLHSLCESCHIYIHRNTAIAQALLATIHPVFSSELETFISSLPKHRRDASKRPDFKLLQESHLESRTEWENGEEE